MIKGLILDMDGTLLDSRQMHLKAWKILLRKYKVEKTESDILAHFGKTTEEIARNIFPVEFDFRKIGAEKDEIFITLIPNVDVFQGVPQLLNKLRQKRYRLCLASSNPRKTIQTIISHFNLSVDKLVSIEDIIHGKPAPDMILAAASKLNLSIAECLAVGDTPYDIQAAKAAKCKVVAVSTGGYSIQTLQEFNPDYILPSIIKIEAVLGTLS
ncbi:MAG: HAD family phosphatase [Candidatus Helarchaeota archaeon]|nr:HAD family phosphatase [Candidatus Helarchaeota archaeon]